MVDFPPPEGPTMATLEPCGMEKERLLKIGTAGRVGYAKETFSKRMVPRASGTGRPRVGDKCRFAVLKLEKTGGCSDAFHKFRVEGGETEHGGAAVEGIHEEGGEVTNGESPGLDHPAAEPQDYQHGHVAGETRRGVETVR